VVCVGNLVSSGDVVESSKVLSFSVLEGFVMNPFGNDLKAGFEFNQTIKPQATAATETAGDYIDCANYEGPMTCVIWTGVCTDGNYLPSLEEKATASGDGTAITPYSGAFETITSSNDDEVVVVQFKRTLRYVRVVLDETSAGSTGVLICAGLIGRKKNV
jgi:hypothetical protein